MQIQAVEMLQLMYNISLLMCVYVAEDLNLKGWWLQTPAEDKHGTSEEPADIQHVRVCFCLKYEMFAPPFIHR